MTSLLSLIRSARHASVLLWGVSGMLLLAACGLPLDVEQQQEIGGAEPKDTIIGFVDTFNEALQDPQITSRDTRLVWAERLASYFAPSERVDQRVVMSEMLARFAAGLEGLNPNQNITIEITYSGVQVIEGNNNLAMVRLQDASIRYRHIQVSESGYRNVLKDQQRPLYDALGMDIHAFPVVQVDGRWFLSER